FNRVPVRLPVVLAGGDQRLDIGLGQVLTGTHGVVARAPWRGNFPYFDGWRHDPQGWFGHDWQALSRLAFRYTAFLRKATRPFRWFSLREMAGEDCRPACRVRTDMERLANRAILRT